MLYFGMHRVAHGRQSFVAVQASGPMSVLFCMLLTLFVVSAGLCLNNRFAVRHAAIPAVPGPVCPCQRPPPPAISAGGDITSRVPPADLGRRLVRSVQPALHRVDVITLLQRGQLNRGALSVLPAPAGCWSCSAALRRATDSERRSPALLPARAGRLRLSPRQ